MCIRDSTNTVWLYVCPLRTMVFIAINNEWLTRDPFREYEIKKEETTRSFLTKDEIRLLMDTSFSRSGVQYLKTGTSMGLSRCDFGKEKSGDKPPDGR